MFSNKPIVFSGVQPSGNLHLGNYLGAIAQWVVMQEKNQCIFCVVDYHAITVKQEPAILAKKIIEVAKIYLASGIDPKKSIIFQQSDISAHTELTWILNCVANAGELKRMTQFGDKTGILSLKEQKDQGVKKLTEKFKDLAEENVSRPYSDIKPKIKEFIKEYRGIADEKKSEEYLYNVFLLSMTKGGEIAKNYFEESYENIIKLNQNLIEDENKKFNNSNVGLFDYPILMAADILLYNTDAVPVGEDQAQHVELCRTLAKRFNSQFGETFKIPEVVIRKEGARIMGLDDPTKKMSKSAESEYNFIGLTDKPEAAAKKIMKAVTDSGHEIKYDEKTKPAISNLLTVYSLLSDEPMKKLEAKYKGRGYGDFKKDLAEVVKKFLTDFQERYKKISDKEVEKILEDGAKKVKLTADETLKRVKEKIGIN